MMILLLALWRIPLKDPFLGRLERLPTFDVRRAERAYPGIRVTAETNPVLRAKAKRELTRAMARYPAREVARRLGAVYVVRMLSWEGVQMGGTSSPDGRGLYIAVGEMPLDDGDWIEGTFHHEFAHVLFERFQKDLPLREWKSANAPGFRYTYGADGGFEAVSKNANVSEELNPALNAQGLLSEYGATEIGEDWATYAERILRNDFATRAVVRRYPRVRAKARLLAAFYRRALPGIKIADAP